MSSGELADLDNSVLQSVRPVDGLSTLLFYSHFNGCVFDTYSWLKQFDQFYPLVIRNKVVISSLLFLFREADVPWVHLNRMLDKVRHRGLSDFLLKN